MLKIRNGNNDKVENSESKKMKREEISLCVLQNEGNNVIKILCNKYSIYLRNESHLSIMCSHTFLFVLFCF